MILPNSSYYLKMQVQQQVIEVVIHIASTASKFPKKCVVLCIAGKRITSISVGFLNYFTSEIYLYTLTGICERVADIKTRIQAMKCLTTFSEAVGPGFIFERVSV